MSNHTADSGRRGVPSIDLAVAPVSPRAVDKRARPGNVGSAVAAEPPADLGKVGTPAEPPEAPEQEQPVPTATTDAVK